MALNKVRIQGENLQDLLFLRLKRLQSARICERIIDDKEKALDIASVIKSSLGFLESMAESLNQWILNRYYGLLQLTIAEQLSKGIDLDKIQNSSSQGHGLGTELKEGDPKEKLLVYFKKEGYLSHYLSTIGIPLNDEFKITTKESNDMV